MKSHQGGCLCGNIRYQVSGDPQRVSFCHCRYCQRASGAAFAVEALFKHENHRLLQGTPRTYAQRSKGSDKIIRVHFCDNCGSGLHYSFERFADLIGIHAGTFDDPNWFEYNADNAKHIFLDDARHDTVIPPGLPSYRQNNTGRDGSTVKATVHTTPHQIVAR